jgi:malate dehydrogenase (oxaloacetate-decarboxylating)
MKLAAARALADVVAVDELHADYIIPSPFHREAAGAVATAVAAAAHESGVARRTPPASGS